MTLVRRSALLIACLLCLSLTQRGAHAFELTDADTGTVLPTFQEGSHAGYHAVFNRWEYTATINGDASLSIHMRRDGLKITDAPLVNVRLHCYYLTQEQKGMPRSIPHRRIIESVSVSPESPAVFKHPRAIRIEGTLTDGVPFKLKFAFDENQVTVSASVHDQFNPYPTVPAIEIEMPALGTNKTVTAATARDTFSGYKLKLHQFDGGVFNTWHSYAFTDTPTLHNGFDEASIKGPWGPRSLKIYSRLPSSVKHYGDGNNRHNVPLWQGFRFYFAVPNDRDDLSHTSVVFTIK